MARKPQKDLQYLHLPMKGEFLNEFHEVKKLTGIDTNNGVIRFAVRFVKNHFSGKKEE